MRRLSSIPLTLLCLLDSGDAFAPPSPSAKTYGTRLQAQASGLKNLLNEYSDSATETAADVVINIPDAPVKAAKIAAAAPVPIPEVVQSKTDAISWWAEQASNAAAATKSAATTKGAAAAKTGGVAMAGGLDLTQINSDLATIKANFMEGIAGIQPDATIIEALHLKENGAWFIAAALALVASQQRSAGKKQAITKYEEELSTARAVADEAVQQAGAAAEGARTAQTLAIQAEKDMKKGKGNNAVLESSREKLAQMEKVIMEKEISSLQAEVASLRSQLVKDTPKKATQKKRAPTKKAVQLDRDPEEDKRILGLIKMVDEENKDKKKKREKSVNTQSVEKIRVEKGAETAKSRAKSPAIKKSTQKITKASTETVTEAQTSFFGLKMTDEEIKNEKTKREKSANTQAAEKIIVEKVAESAKSRAESPVTKKSTQKITKASTGTVTQAQRSFFDLKMMDEENKDKKKKREKSENTQAAEKITAEKGAESVKNRAESPVTKKSTRKITKASTKKVTQTTSTKKKAAIAKTAANKSEKWPHYAKTTPAVATKEENWAMLADSTLKRKNIAQLTEYLTGKGVSVVNDSGKSLKKADLIEAVRKL